MPLTPIRGASTFIAGANSNYTNATAGGVWSSADVTIATVNASTGVATGVAQGATQIVYTIGGSSTALNVQVNATGIISNGYNPTQILDALKNQVLWPSQGTSISGRYFTDGHPLCDETILAALPNVNNDYPGYLSSLNNSVILECVNSVYNKPQLIDSSQLIFKRSDVMLVTQPVDNQNQFVGIKMQLAPGDYRIKVNNLMLFFTEDVTFNMYLYNDFDLPPIYTLQVSARAYQQVIIPLQNNVMLNYLTPTDNKGGIWYFGYRQADLGTAKAIFYPVGFNRFHCVSAYAFSAPTYIDPLGQVNFLRSVVGANNITYGLNLEIATMVDATNNIVSNPSLWIDFIILRMACKVLEICKFSYQTGAVQRAVQAIGGVDELNTALNGRPYNSMTGQSRIVGIIRQAEDAGRVVKDGFQPEFKCGIGLL